MGASQGGVFQEVGTTRVDTGKPSAHDPVMVHMYVSQLFSQTLTGICCEDNL